MTFSRGNCPAMVLTAAATFSGSGFDGVVLNEAVLVSDAKRVEKRRHHRALFGEVIDDEGAGGKGVGQRREAGEMLGLPLVVERQDRLRAEFLLLRDQHHGLNLVVCGLFFAPERPGGEQPLL